MHPKDGSAQSPGDSDDEEGECSGDWTSGTIVDQVMIPASLKPGDYVVGWCALPFRCLRSALAPLWFRYDRAASTNCGVFGRRWDCEETTQIWSSCADVKII